MTDWVLTASVAFVFLVALGTIYFERHSLDRCLSDFNGYQVTVHLRDGREIWGRLVVYPNGIELLYGSPHTSAKGHKAKSYILNHGRMGEIQSIRRYHDELLEERQAERLKEVKRTASPSLLRRLLRRSRNFLNTFRDAFNQSIGVLMSRAKTGGQLGALGSQDKELRSLSGRALGVAANTWEPILERYVSRPVILSEDLSGERVDRSGVLKEYTAEWVEVLNCSFLEEHCFSLSEPEQLRINKDIDLSIYREEGNLSLSVSVHGETPVSLLRVEGATYDLQLNAPLAPGEVHQFTLEGLKAGDLGWPQDTESIDFRRETASSSSELNDLRIVFEAERTVDLCLPRELAELRHAGD